MAQDYEQRRQQIVRSVSRDEEELQRALADLKSAARNEWEQTRERLDVKHQIAMKPMGFMVGAFCVGLWFGWSIDL